MSGEDDKFRVEFQLPASWRREIADVWRAVSGPAAGALGALQQRTFLWQLNNAAEIFERAKSLADEYGLKLNPVPPKFLIPFLEKAGLESEHEGELRDAWARLLVNESQKSSALHIAYLDILSAITASEVRVLDELAQLGNLDSGFRFPSKVIEKNASRHFVKFIDDIRANSKTIGELEDWLRSVEKGATGLDGRAIEVDLPVMKDDSSMKGILTGKTVFYNQNKDSLDVLLRQDVLEQLTASTSLSYSGSHLSLVWIRLSDFGLAFYRACNSISSKELKTPEGDQ